MPASAVEAYKTAAGWSTYTGKIIANPVYAVTVETTDGGTASASPVSAVEEMKITLTATPKDGYHFVGWQVVSGDITIVGNQFIMPAEAVTVKAVFAPHSSAGGWQSDATGHWKVCDACHITFQEGTHTAAPDDGDCTTAIRCTECDYLLTPGQSEHSYQWTSNNNGTHTGRCTHDGCQQQLADQSCTYDESGTCTFCGYERITITAQPQSVTVTEGGAAAFAVAATGSSITSYQWQASADGGATWADIGGATGDSYTIQAAALDMDGRQYRCVVSNSGDSATSAAATLTVARRDAGDRPAAPLWDISLEAGQGGTVEVWPERAAMSTTVTITATPHQGYGVEEVVVTAENGDQLTVTEKADNQYTFRMPGGEVTVAVTFRPLPPSGADTPAAHPFADVPAGHWAYDAVRYVWENGLMAGTGADVFSPEGVTTRGQLVTILWRLSDSPVVNYLMDYSDVDPAAYYAEAIRWATSEGIVGGYGGGLFGPDDAITREQLAVMLYRYAQYEGYDTTQGGMAIREYADYEQISDFALEALDWAVSAGIINGTSASTLSPSGSATRAQAAVMLQRFCERFVELS